MAYVGRFINMDASRARRERIEAQFERLGCADRYARFAGIDGRTLDSSRSPLSPGELGCFMSHYRCLTETDLGEGHLHIVEDDVVFAPQTLSVLDQILDEAMASYDLVFTDIFVPLDLLTVYDLIRLYRRTGLIDKRLEPPLSRMPHLVMYRSLQDIAFGATPSYLVSRRSRDKLVALLEDELERGPTLPIDMLLRGYVNQGRLEAACTLPFLTSVEPEEVCESTIFGRNQHGHSAMAFYGLRNFFYVARDDEQLSGLMRAANAELADPDYLGPLLEVFRFLFSERFVIF